MSMNRYGVKAQRHWARWLPRQSGMPTRAEPACGPVCLQVFEGA